MEWAFEDEVPGAGCNALGGQGTRRLSAEDRLFRGRQNGCDRQATGGKGNEVSVISLGEHTKKATTDISKQIGHNQTPLIINFGKDYPLYQIK